MRKCINKSGIKISDYYNYKKEKLSLARLFERNWKNRFVWSCVEMYRVYKIFPDYPTAYLWAYPCGNILMDGKILSNAGFHKTPKWLQKAFLKWAFYFNRCVEEKNDKKYLWEKHYQVGKKLTTKLSALYTDIVFRYSAPYEYEARRTELIIFNKNDQEGGK